MYNFLPYLKGLIAIAVIVSSLTGCSFEGELEKDLAASEQVVLNEEAEDAYLWIKSFDTYQDLTRAEFLDMTQLSLNGKDLKLIPKSIRTLNKLTILSLKNINLKLLPEEIGELTNLEYLYLRGSALETLPKSFPKLVNLKVLDLSGTRLKHLPKGLDKMKKMQWFSAKHSDIPIVEQQMAEKILPATCAIHISK